MNASKLTKTALGIALVCVATRMLQVPIPLGYAHLGNGFILLFAWLLGPLGGALAGGIGSMLTDLLSFPSWAIPTLLIKSLMGYLCGRLAQGNLTGNERISAGVRSRWTFLAVIAATAEMVAGYFLAGSVMYGSVALGAAQIPGLAAEGIIGIALFYLVAPALEKVPGLRQK